MAEPMFYQSQKHYITLGPQNSLIYPTRAPVGGTKAPPQTYQVRNWCGVRQCELHQFSLQGALMYAQVYKSLL